MVTKATDSDAIGTGPRNVKRMRKVDTSARSGESCTVRSLLMLASMLAKMKVLR